MSVFTRSAQSKIDALPAASRPKIVPAVLRAFDSPQITYPDPKTGVEHRICNSWEVLVSPTTGKIILFRKVSDAPEPVKVQAARLTYRERHLAARRGKR